PYAGTYRSNQLRVDVSAVDGQLEEKMTYEPLDDTQERIFTGFAGGSPTAPPRRYVPIRTGLFAPAGMPFGAFNGYSRQLLVAYRGGSPGYPDYRGCGGSMPRTEYIPGQAAPRPLPCPSRDLPRRHQPRSPGDRLSRRRRARTPP